MGCSDADLDERVRALELQRRRIEAELHSPPARSTGAARTSTTGTARSRPTCAPRATTPTPKPPGSVASPPPPTPSPGLADALHDGRIGTPQANELAIAHTNARIRDRLVEFAPMLLELAERLSFREFRTCVQRFVMLADLDGAHRDLDESIRNRRAHVVNLNGSLCLDGGGGDPLVNVELEAIFRLLLRTRVRRRRRRPPRRTRRPRRRTPTPAHRRPTQLRRLRARSCAARSPTIEPAAPLRRPSRWSTILDRPPHLGRRARRRRPRPRRHARRRGGRPVHRAWHHPATCSPICSPTPTGSPTRRCETSTGQILHPHTVLRAALAGHIRRAVLGADSLPINLGRKVPRVHRRRTRRRHAPRHAVRSPRLRPARRSLPDRPLHRMVATAAAPIRTTPASSAAGTTG